jgi:hypothetical protein
MTPKEKNKKTPKITPLMALLGISVLVNLCLLSNFFMPSYDTTTPLVIRNLNNKYQELLKDNSEADAQQKLLLYLQSDPAVKKAEIRNNQEPEPPGIWAEWCGAEGALGDSWENLKNVH